jgi:hypothetical protein
MLYACIGAHRSGKTTTAQKVAEQLGIEFVDASFNVAREFGYDPVGFLPLADRLLMQMKVMEHHLKVIEAAQRPAITDRTPLDFFAYTLAEYGILSHVAANDAELLATVKRFSEVCIQMTVMHYDMVFLLETLPVYVVDNTKATPAENPAFQLHIDSLIHGALSKAHSSDLNYAVVPVMEQQKRVDFICDQIVERMNDIEELRKVAGMH